MPTSAPAVIDPDVLLWARETSGYTLDEAARRLGFKDPSKLAAAEAGDSHLTVAQLRSAARLYKRPLAAFFLPSRPPTEPIPRDFRRIPGADHGDLPPALRLAIRQAHRRRNIALRLYAEIGVEAPLFTLRTNIGEGSETVAERARAWLEVSLAAQRGFARYTALRHWIDAVEARGVLVFQASRIPVRTMRGCSIAGDRLPAVVLNGSDAPSARIFTLMHELTHLMLGEAGVCGPIWSASDETSVEAFCNRVAGAILLPSRELLDNPIVTAHAGSGDWDEAEVGELADAYAVSRETVLIRLLGLDRASRAFVSRKLEEYRRAYQSPAAARASNEGGPSYTVLAVRNNGSRFTRLVMDALERNQISIPDATDYLGIRARHFPEVAARVGL